MAKRKRKSVEPAPAPIEECQKTTAPPGEVLEAMIACRAYEKWQQRGCPLWEDQQDWFTARAEIEQERGGVEVPS